MNLRSWRDGPFLEESWETWRSWEKIQFIAKTLEVLENFQQQILIAVDKKLGINTSLPSSLDFWNP